jgi:hypothetical protein
MDDIILCQFIIKDKEENIKKLQKEIFYVEQELQTNIKKYINDNREEILQDHYHYKNNHTIDALTDYYYDYDWYYETYGKKHPVDEFGRLPLYEGPNKIIYISCSECNIYLDKPYREESKINDSDDIYISTLAKDRFDNYILQNKIKELST